MRLNRRHLALGDITRYPCSNKEYAARLADMNAIRHPVSYQPLETFGSPDIGWVRVVVDSVAGRIVAFESRLMPRWLLR